MAHHFLARYRLISCEEQRARTKNVIITGGGSGIGAATALSFAKACASSVALLGRTESKLRQTKATIAEAYPRTKATIHIADVTDATEVDHAFSAISKEVGTLHVLINNAGLGDIGPVIKDADVDFGMNNMNTDVKGSLHVVQAFLRHAAADATVVNVASLASFIPLMGSISAYTVSKAASVALFSALQVENPELRVVNLQPGVVETEMNRKSGLPGLDDVEFSLVRF